MNVGITTKSHCSCGTPGLPFILNGSPTHLSLQHGTQVRKTARSKRLCSFLSAAFLKGACTYLFFVRFSWSQQTIFTSVNRALLLFLVIVQSGLDQLFVLSTLKGQVSASSILLQKPLASQSFLSKLFSFWPFYVTMGSKPGTFFFRNSLMSRLEKFIWRPHI